MPRRRIARRGRAAGSGVSAPAPVYGTLSLSTTTLSLAGTAGSGAAELTDDTFTLTNTGAGSWWGPGAVITYGSGSGWLALAASVATDGTITYTPTVTCTSLSAATYTASITITDGNVSNSGQVVAVTLVVGAASPTLALFPSSLAFTIVDETAAGTAQTTTLSNSGHGTLAAPAVGTITGAGAAYIQSVGFTDNGDDTYTVTVTPTATGGTVGGPYAASIPITSAGATNTPITLTANVTVTSAAGAVLALDRTLDDVRFTVGDPTAPTQTVGFRNVGSGTLAGVTVQSTSYSGAFTGFATATISGNTLSVALDTSGIGAEGVATASIVLADANAAATATYQVYIKSTAATLTPQLIVQPSAIGATAQEGANAAATTIAITNANGTVAELGTVSVAFVPGVPWCSPSYTTGQVTLTYATTTLAQGTYSGSLVLTASLAGNSPVTVPVGLTITAATTPSNYPQPQLATIANGWTWNAALGYPEGSCFNELGALAAGYDGARPAFAGTVHTIPGSYASWTAAMAAVTAGTIVVGDIIRIDKGQTITDPQFPVIPGWTAGDGFICVQSSDMASLPAYSYDSGLDSYGVDNRGGKDSHLAFMPTMQTTTLNRSVLNFQIGTGGWWLEGIRIHANTTKPTQAIVSFGPRSGTSPSGANVLANLPQCLVVDRCRFSSATGHQNVFEQHGRYVRITHSTLDFARRPGTASDNTENKVGYMVTTDGHFDFLGNECSSLGIGIIIGGSDPQIPNINPSDGMVMWNRYRVPDLTGLPDQDDSKNFFENKTGRRWFVGFNVVSGLWMRPDQKHGFIWKAVDTPNYSSGSTCASPQTLFAAHVTDICYWANLIYDSAKNFCGGADTYNGGCGVGGAIGSERIEVAWNLHLATWTGRVPTKWTLQGSDLQQMALYKSAGDGIPGVHLYHNTFGNTDRNDNSWLEVDTVALGTGWSNVVLRDNVCISAPNYGPVRGNQSGNTTALNGTFGPGNWLLQRNLIAPGGAAWDTTLLGGNYLNGYLVAGGVANNFVAPASRNYTLVPGHPKATASTDGIPPGYNHTYLTAMTSTVLADGE